MVGDIFISLFIAVPIVLLTAAFVWHMEKRREDMDRMDQYIRDEKERRDDISTPGPTVEQLDRAR